MKTITLNELLQGQDLNPDMVCDRVLINTFNATDDLLTGLLIKIHKDNEMGTDIAGMQTDFNYYISQLQKAKSNLPK